MINNFDECGKGFELIQSFLNHNYSKKVSVIEFRDTRYHYIKNKVKGKIEDLDYQCILSYAKHSKHAKEILSEENARKLLNVRNVLCHAKALNLMDEDSYNFCIQEITEMEDLHK